MAASMLVHEMAMVPLNAGKDVEVFSLSCSAECDAECVDIQLEKLVGSHPVTKEPVHSVSFHPPQLHDCGVQAEMEGLDFSMEAAEDAAMGTFTFQGEVFDLTKASHPLPNRNEYTPRACCAERCRGRRGPIAGRHDRSGEDVLNLSQVAVAVFGPLQPCCFFRFLGLQRAERAVAVEIACLLHQLSTIASPSPLKLDGGKCSLFTGLLTSPQVGSGWCGGDGRCRS